MPGGMLHDATCPGHPLSRVYPTPSLLSCYPKQDLRPGAGGGVGMVGSTASVWFRARAAILAAGPQTQQDGRQSKLPQGSPSAINSSLHRMQTFH